MSGIFEHLAAFDDSERVAARKAVAVATKRVQTQFGAFLASATDADRAARVALIQDDLDAVVASVVSEYGGDYDKIRMVIADLTTMPRDTAGQWSSPEQLQDAQQSDIDSELEKAPSAVGADAGAGVLSSHTAGHADDCECGFCTNKGSFGKDEEEDEDKDDDEDGEKKTAADAPAGAGGASKRESLPKADASGLGGPSPKIDKAKSGDQDGWNSKPIDTEMSGTPHPTVDQDITQKPEFDKEDFLAQTDSVTTQEDLPSNSGDAGFDDGGVNHGDNTDTWTEAQNDPVTNTALASVDPDKNPITEIMSSWEDDTSSDNSWVVE
jgi:hypothetical protein